MRPLEQLLFVRAFLARRTNLLAFGVLLVFLTGALIQAVNRPLWNDEYYTFAVAEQPSLGAMFHALDQGVDLNPPLFHLVTRLTTQIAGLNRVGLRLPAMLGFVVMMAGIYLFVLRALPDERGRICGLIAMILPVLTGIEYYASEGRAYGLMLGFISVSLLFWQSSLLCQSSGRRWIWALLCGFAFGCAVLTHAYAVFVLGPMILAEGVCWFESRRWNWSFLVVPFCGLGAAALVLQHLQKGSATNTKNYAASWQDIDQFSSTLFSPSSTELGLLVAALAAFWYFFQPGPEPGMRDETAENTNTTTYMALALGLFLLPYAIVPLSAAVKLLFTFRFAAAAGIGLAFISAWLMFLLDRWRAGSLVIGLAVFAGGFAVHEGRIIGHYIHDPHPVAERPAFDDPEAKQLPIFAQDPYLYTELLFTWPAEKRANLHYVLDAAMYRKMIGPSLTEANIAQLFSVRAMQVETYSELRQDPRKFLLYYDSAVTRDAIKGWLLKKLIDDGTPVQLLRRHGDILVYVVTLPEIP